jgi:acyl-CoA thioester hydrolase
MQHQLPQHSETILSEWVDYNGHMNVAYYVLIFDHATDVLLDYVGLNEKHRNITSESVFVVESHIVYEQEVLEGTKIEIETLVLDVDDKRLQVFMTMREVETGMTAATIEIMMLYVDLKIRKSTPFPTHIKLELARLKENNSSLIQPSQIGRQIGLKKLHNCKIILA